MKHCKTCGAEVPVGAAYCARCGALAPQAFSEYGVSPSGATVASSSDAATQLSHNPYENPLSPPPPPPPPQWRFPLRLKIVMVGLILLLLIESGALYYLTAFRLNRPLTPTPVSTQPSSAATIQTLRATLTAVADPEGIYTQATSGLPVRSDQLNESEIDTTDWYKGSGDGYSCGFAAGAYHAITTGTARYTWCNNLSTNYSNFAYQVQMKVLKGVGGGIIFRSKLETFSGYMFYLDRNGTYTLYLSTDANNGRIVRSKSSSLIKTGLNETNVITLVASGNNIYLYVNKQYLTHLNEDSYTSGQIGLSAESGQFPSADVVFNNVQVWKV